MNAKILQFVKKYSLFFELICVFIITVPAFLSLLNNGYFSMHDDQHIVRLFLFDTALKQGQLYPRWVDGLGFGYGYPLFNFYPPFIYFVAEFFHLIGFTFIWSMKMVVIFGYIIAAMGMYLLIKRITDKLTAFLGATLYTYFFYHSVTAYVRGALAEFFAMSVIPFLFLAMDKGSERKTLQNSIFFGIAFAILILTHPLIAFPSVFYIILFFVFYVIIQKNNQERIRLFYFYLRGGMIGLFLSAFFWIPSILEKKYTLVDSILLTELANYAIHFVYPFQFLYSMWGYGGSVNGPSDGLTFQLGKVHMGLAVLAVGLFIVVYKYLRKKNNRIIPYTIFFGVILAWSLFMIIPASKFIWDNVSFLWYLQFPWRFLTFVTFFISAIGAFTIYFIKYVPIPKIQLIRLFCVGVFILGTVGIYSKYFKPQTILNVTDAQRTSDDEVLWRISRSSFEFIPKGVTTKKSELNTTIPTINKNEVSREQFKILSGTAEVTQTKNLFHEQKFAIKADSPITFRSNTFYFPGWKACIKKENNCDAVSINDANNLKLITLSLPKGNYQLEINFIQTSVRMIADIISITSLLIIITYFVISLHTKALLKQEKSL